MTGAYRERGALPFVPRVSKVVPRHIQYRFTYVSAGPSLLVTIKEACRVAYWQDVGPSARLPAKSLPLGPSGPSEYVALGNSFHVPLRNRCLRLNAKTEFWKSFLPAGLAASIEQTVNFPGK